MKVLIKSSETPNASYLQRIQKYIQTPGILELRQTPEYDAISDQDWFNLVGQYNNQPSAETVKSQLSGKGYDLNDDDYAEIADGIRGYTYTTFNIGRARYAKTFYDNDWHKNAGLCQIRKIAAYDNQDYHFAQTYDFSNWKIYLKGRQVATFPVDSSGDTVSIGEELLRLDTEAGLTPRMSHN